ncbi:GNAT family N-acetyltransferase [Candidatus Lokiarchaeum ossiferum]|uniref:GNAT family N-acetyltransferase n=1 Tax=Candidatus Lokiarchaeum ossiferum TaxID=2951803 RepID=UPI00352FAFC1
MTTHIKLPEIKEFYRLKSSDFDRGCKILGKAFRDDPIWKEILFDAPEKFSVLFGVPLKYALKYGIIYSPSSELEGIAVWLDSSKVEMNMWRMMRSGSIPIAMKLGGKIAGRMSKTFSQITKDRRKNIEAPYYYLYVLGIASDRQGQGIGSKFMQKFIENLPPKVPLYLETESERNVHFYEKLGFKVVKKITIPTYNLPMWEMVHPGRKEIQ